MNKMAENYFREPPKAMSPMLTKVTSARYGIAWTIATRWARDRTRAALYKSKDLDTIFIYMLRKMY